MPESLRGFTPLLFLALVVLIAVTLLSFTNSITSPVVEKRLQQQVIDQMEGMFPNVSDWDFEDDLYTLYTDSEKIGYAFLATGAGYHGEISILVGLENAETVKGIVILSQTETPGVGSRITEPDFLNQFIGVSIGDIALTQNGGLIDGLTGATISSGAVVDTVRQTAMDKVAQIEVAE